MANTDHSATVDYARAQEETTQNMIEQLVALRQKFTSLVNLQPVEEEDRLFAAQMAARLLELTLRPHAVHDRKQVEQLVRPYGSGKFKTDLTVSDLIEMIATTGAIHRGHFELLSEMHSDYFFMFSRLGTRVDYRKRLAEELAARLQNLDIETVVAPVSAGGLLLQDVAAAIKASLAFYDVDDHSRPIGIRRGYSAKGRTVILNDMTTTGLGIKRMVKSLKQCGAEPVALALVSTRGETGLKIASEVSQQDSIRVEVLFHLAIEALPKDQCQKCKLGLPFVKSADINR